jgi:hypothetical protein
VYVYVSNLALRTLRVPLVSKGEEDSTNHGFRPYFY